MSIIKYACGGALGNYLYNFGKEHLEEKRKEQATLEFPVWLNKNEFINIVEKACHSSKRIKKVTVKGTFIEIVVQSEVALKDWKFCLDFNDNGELTGKYWSSTDRIDSKLPKLIAEKICRKIEDNRDSYLEREK